MCIASWRLLCDETVISSGTMIWRLGMELKLKWDPVLQYGCDPVKYVSLISAFACYIQSWLIKLLTKCVGLPYSLSIQEFFVGETVTVLKASQCFHLWNWWKHMWYLRVKHTRYIMRIKIYIKWIVTEILDQKTTICDLRGEKNQKI